MAKDKQLNLMVTQEQIDLFEQAAVYTRRSRTAFILGAAEYAARNALRTVTQDRSPSSPGDQQL